LYKIPDLSVIGEVCPPGSTPVQPEIAVATLEEKKVEFGVLTIDITANAQLCPKPLPLGGNLEDLDWILRNGTNQHLTVPFRY
jgi:hypothetical protein